MRDIHWFFLLLLLIALAFRIDWEHTVAQQLIYEQQVCSGEITNYKAWEIDCESRKRFYP